MCWLHVLVLLSSVEVQAAVRERQAMKNRQQLQQTLSNKHKAVFEGAEGKPWQLVVATQPVPCIVFIP